MNPATSAPRAPYYRVMEPCDCDREALLALALGQLDGPEAARIEENIRGCPACQEELLFHQQVAGDLARRPAAPMPPDLREVLIRSAIQTRRDASPAWVGQSGPRTRVAWTPVICTGAGLAIVGMLVLLVLPGGGPTGSVDDVVAGGVGRGATALEEILQLLANLQAGWELTQTFFQRFAPLTRAVQTGLGAIGLLRWLVALLSVLGVIGLLWRFGRVGQKGRVEHA